MNYYGQLHCLPELVCQFYAAPTLSSVVFKRLVELNSLRNKVVHGQTSEGDLSYWEVADLVFGATFGVHYMRFLTSQVQRQIIPSSSKPPVPPREP